MLKATYERTLLGLPCMLVCPTDMALSCEAAPVGLQASTTRDAAEGGGPSEAVVNWDAAARLRQMQRLYGQSVRSLRAFETSGTCARGLRICSGKRSNAPQLDFEPPGALVFADEYSGAAPKRLPYWLRKNTTSHAPHPSYEERRKT